MGVLTEIQAAVLDGKSSLADSLLKMRFLAARLGSSDLAAWVKREAEGYPPDCEIPDYRRVGIAYYGTFFGPFNAQIANAPIPNSVMYALVGKHSLEQCIGESIAGVEKLVALADEHGVLQTNHADYIPHLQGRVYPNYSCNSIVGKISASSLTGIVTIVRSKLLDLTLEIDNKVPEAKDIILSSAAVNSDISVRAVEKIVNQVVYGNVSNVTNTGDGSHFTVSVSQGSSGDVVETLAKAGIAEPDAKDFASLLASERPSNRGEPFGDKTKNWIVENISKSLNGTWKIGLPIATALLAAAAEKYYGLK